MALWPDTTRRDDSGVMTVGDCRLTNLASEFGTPLYVFDEATLRTRARRIRDVFGARYTSSRIVYGGKAYLSPAIVSLFASEGIGLDVVSGGEIYGGRLGGMPPQRMVLHGNNKSERELLEAIEAGVGLIVIDNEEEIARLESVLATLYGRSAAIGTKVRVLLRLNPGVDVHTHAKIQTGIVDSKFGLPLWTGDAERAAARVQRSSWLEGVGYHMHLGSQLTETNAMEEAIGKAIAFAAETGLGGRAGGWVLSPGGGLGIAYTPAGEEMEPETWADAICGAVEQSCDEFALPLPELIIEPGRWLVGPAAVALYEVGSIKRFPEIRTYVAVDGGMADNLRPALYGAPYTAEIANREPSGPSEDVRIAGRYCESGDILIDSVSLPPVEVGDLLAVPAAGAYQLPMASNYNAVPRPAVVMVAEGQARVIRRRERYEDVFAAEVAP